MDFSVDISYKSLNKYSEELCGDKVEVIRNDNSVIIVLADGLGSGVKANILATLTSKIIGTMLKEGAEVSDAVETIISTLPVCSKRKLAYSTFSILQIFDDGNVYVVEFDNPNFILIRQGEIVSIPKTKLVIKDKTVLESRFRVEVFDTFGLVSDGVIHAGVGASLNFGWQWDNAAKYISENSDKGCAARISACVCEMCNELYNGKMGDDTTCCIVKVVNNAAVNIFTGPPVDKTYDEEIVEAMINAVGKKVVCGGTSANIAARVLNKEVKAEISYFDAEIPPTGHIDGIDLVTEGVITLQTVLNMLTEFEKGKFDADFFKRLDEENGASKLCKMLLEESNYVNFFVGRVVNEAHKGPGVPMYLSAKLRIIEELNSALTAIGKKVHIKYY